MIEPVEGSDHGGARLAKLATIVRAWIGRVRQGMSNRIFAFVLIMVIAVIAVVLGVVDLSRGWTIAFQIASAVAGAALGNALRIDASAERIRDQARPATRLLFDQVFRLRALVVRTEEYQATISDPESGRIDRARIADWFGHLGGHLRDEINATASAIENWGDLAKDVRDEELANFNQREQRLPTQQNGDQDRG